MAARVQPRWERVQRAKGAAAYAGYRNERDFLLAVNQGLMPPPFDHAGADAWDIVDLDAAIETLKAATAAAGKRKGSWRERAPDRV